MLGRPQAQDGKFSYLSAEFIQAIQDNQSLVVLKMAPWYLPEFRLFITNLLLKRSLIVNGKEYKVPADFKILRDDTPYIINKGNHNVADYSSTSDLKDAYVVNKMTLNSLFQRHKIKDGKINTLAGIITEYSHKKLTLYISDTISQLQWAHILDEAKKHETDLNIIIGNNVVMPKELQPIPIIAEAKTSDPAVATGWGWSALLETAKRVASDVGKSWQTEIPVIKVMIPTQAQFIETNDIDLATARKELIVPGTIVIPVNEKTTYADLVGMEHITRHPDGSFDIKYSQGEFTTALLNNQSVILKGQLSLSLTQQLESLFLPKPYLQTNGQRIDSITGKVTIITDQNIHMPTVAHDTQQFNSEDSWQMLAKSFDPQDIKKLRTACDFFYQSSGETAFDFIQLKTMLNYHRKHLFSNPLKTILRANANYQKLQSIAEVAWKKSVGDIKKEKSKSAVIEKRINKLECKLKNDWHVFVAGSSGVGKSTTILRAMKQMGYKLIDHPGSIKDKLKALVTSGEKSAVFFDEANLYEAGAFDILEGLYGKPPRLLIDGVFYTMPEDCRIVFAGNFGHFQGRQQLNFIKKHGKVITFKEFEDDFLHDSIMRPVAKSLHIKDAESIENHFLNIYHYLYKQNPEKHPMTARNLQMMMMRYANLQQNFKQSDAITLAIYDEVSGILNQKMRHEFTEWLEKSYKVDIKKLKAPSKLAIADKLSPTYVITKKRKNPINILNKLMAARELKITHPELASAGSSGIILEGSPGIGKSELAIQYLESLGFVNGDIVSRAEAKEPTKRYYYLKTTDPVEIEKIILKAFDEGAALIIDEMNTLAIEHILNAVLSGINLQGKPATYPGFFIYATQNPIHFGKRHVLSDPLLNRFQKLDLKDYAQEDLLAITSLITGAENEQETVKLVDEFLTALAYAKGHKISREPTARDLFEEAKSVKQGKQATLFTSSALKPHLKSGR